MAAGRPLERSIGTLMTIAENIARIRANMAAAAREAGRDPKEILLVGASKMNDAAACREAIAAGIDVLGENRVQEMTAKLAENAYEAIREAYPDSVKYETNYRLLQQELKALDERTAARIAASDVEYFIIYHPALTYYARDYGLRQIAIEADGKEPSAKQLTQLIRQAREDGVRRILYQSQFPASAVEVIARDIDAEYAEVDPLREDVIANIEEITGIITRR